MAVRVWCLLICCGTVWCGVTCQPDSTGGLSHWFSFRRSVNVVVAVSVCTNITIKSCSLHLLHKQIFIYILYGLRKQQDLNTIYTVAKNNDFPLN